MNDWHVSVYGARSGSRSSRFGGSDGDYEYYEGDFGTTYGRLMPQRGTDRALKAFMQHEEREQQRQVKERQLDLLKEVGSLADAGGVSMGVQTDRRMPIGSVSLRPSITAEQDGWSVRLRIAVPSKSVGYAVKDIRAFVQAVRDRQYVAYGQRLAFVHTRDTFDTRSQGVLDVLDRAIGIRESVVGRNSAYYHQRRPVATDIALSDDEISDLLEYYVDADDTVVYAPPAALFQPAMPTRVIDGDPDLGIVIEPADGGYMIHHALRVERFIQGHRSSFVIVRPMPAADAHAHDSMAESDINNDALAQGDAAAAPFEPAPAEEAVIYRCDDRFLRHRELITMLCGGDDAPVDDTAADGMFLDSDDVAMFARTILPSLGTWHPATADADAADEDSATANSTANDARDTFDEGLAATLPEELAAMRRLPCRLEFYFDRDREGITCDVQARYGTRRFHVFDGADAKRGASLRDRDAERLALEAILHYFPRPQNGVARIAESDAEAIYRLLTEGLPVLRGLGDIFSTPAFDGVNVMPRTVIRLGATMRTGLVEISPLADEIDPKDVPALLASYRKRKRFHRLSNGAFVDLRNVDVERLDRVAGDLGIKPAAFEQGAVEVAPFAAYYLDHEIDDADKDRGFLEYLDDLRVVDPKAYTVPQSLAHILRPYQADGFRWLNAICDKGFGGILADEMGLGKTVQLLSLLLARKAEARKIGPNLIVCPASLVYNWAAECARFAPELKVAAVAGNKASRAAMLADAASMDVLITSYDLLRRDIEDYKGLDCYCMVLDEAQYIKNRATKSAKAVRSISAKHRFALTGTPIENRLSELWSIFDFLMPGILGSYTHFRERFETPILSGDTEAQAKLQAFVGPFILRRLKADVLKDLPEKIENVLTVQLSGEQRRLYSALEQKLRATINKQKDSDFAAERIQVLAQLTRLRQICCDPRLVYEDAKVSAAAGGSAKLDAIDELVESCRDAGRKMLIFSQFTSYLDLIAQRLNENGIRYDEITGSTPKKKRLELVDSFNKDDTPVFLISLKAGNTGLNLTGACVVVHADPWWNAAAQEQANDRAHRIGQQQDVNVYQIVAKDTIEERILNLQRTKKDLASRFVDDAASSGTGVAALTKDDLLALLQ
ncbi:helicase [Bifidobacterium goeldii]|uniref:Helicase n=1 Tax=Bifidobacterium goeldii TaxID=2306975 RepID=A0A430FFR5_9BIFI|nr:DEAD/DEAH box helicase [Bifidobacterium goeldii]RSX51735.1 helicase [Bifidobacterium goeldii]